MKKYLFLILILGFVYSCGERREAIKVIKHVVENLDTVETAYYKQIHSRNFSKDLDYITESARECYFDRLPKDELAGAKAHIFYKMNDIVANQDIYDGYKLIRKNNNYMYAAIYDYKKYPELRKNNDYWNIYTPENIRRVLQAVLKNKSDFDISMIQLDTAYVNNFVAVRLHMDNITLKPGANPVIQKYPGFISTYDFYFDKNNYFPRKIRFEWFHKSDSSKVMFYDDFSYDVKVNRMIVDSVFHTKPYVLKGYETGEMKP